jgi:hypothetical protein
MTTTLKPNLQNLLLKSLILKLFSLAHHFGIGSPPLLKQTKGNP